MIGRDFPFACKALPWYITRTALLRPNLTQEESENDETYCQTHPRACLRYPFTDLIRSD
jgi:hypothetical protein